MAVGGKSVLQHPLLSAVTAQGEFSEFWDHARRVLDYQLFAVQGEPLTLRSLLMAIVFVSIGLVLSRRVSHLAFGRLKRSGRIHASAAGSLESITYYLLTAFFVFTALRMANVPLTVFTVVGGALAIGVGFGSQNIINNFVSGIILLLERPIKIGDIIELGDTFGTVDKIGARSTLVKTPSNMHLIVPNSFFLEKEVLNWTLSDNVIRVEIVVGVAYGSPTREAERIILETAKANPKVLPDPEPYAFFEDFGDSALIFRVLFWVNIEKVSDRRLVAGAIRHSIDEAFKEAGIVIAFPQRDVHLDSLKPVQVRVVKDD